MATNNVKGGENMYESYGSKLSADNSAIPASWCPCKGNCTLGCSGECSATCSGGCAGNSSDGSV